MPRRGENIYKRKDGRWEARFVKEITIDGKKKYGSVYGHSYSEVKQKQKAHIFNPQIIETKNFAQCQGEVRPKVEIIFLFIRDTSGAGASGGPA